MGVGGGVSGGWGGGISCRLANTISSAGWKIPAVSSEGYTEGMSIIA